VKAFFDDCDGVRFNAETTLGVFYSGQFASHGSDNAVEGKFEVQF
jgi:hypothetical protein